MKSLIAFNLTMIALLSQSAFAKDLGALNDKRPQNLLPAQEFVNVPSAPDNNVSEPQNLTSDVHRRGHRGGYGYGYNYPYYYPYSYYPSYYYPYYYYPYYGHRGHGRGHGHGRRHLESNGQNNLTSSVGDARGQVPVVCFAEDSSGHVYADANSASDAVATQERVNQECLGSGVSCSQNLGCAVAFD